MLTDNYENKKRNCILEYNQKEVYYQALNQRLDGGDCQYQHGIYHISMSGSKLFFRTQNGDEYSYDQNYCPEITINLTHKCTSKLAKISVVK